MLRLPAALIITRTYLKNVFWPPAFFGGIGASFKILDIQQYACGYKFGSAAILNQNPIFEMGSRKLIFKIAETVSGRGFLPGLIFFGFKNWGKMPIITRWTPFLVDFCF
jgi:hypothetical protein